MHHQCQAWAFICWGRRTDKPSRWFSKYTFSLIRFWNSRISFISNGKSFYGDKDTLHTVFNKNKSWIVDRLMINYSIPGSRDIPGLSPSKSRDPGITKKSRDYQPYPWRPPKRPTWPLLANLWGASQNPSRGIMRGSCAICVQNLGEIKWVVVFYADIYFASSG